ncbi:MAG: metal ABC transporter permease [Candidatus Aminicenantes bacterium]|nr:metal ABC transporter permease [Candidatus Aminicenantes bacterium]
MIELLAMGFIQRALLAGLLLGVACALLGVFLILKRDAMIGHGLAHVAFAGVALGLWVRLLPLGLAMAVTIGSALVLVRLKQKAGVHGDTALGIVSSVGMALGILLASLARSFNASLFGFLFGEILAVAPAEVVLAGALALAVAVLVAVRYRPLMAMAFHPEIAKASGVRVERLETALMVLAAVTVVLGMKVVGVLLVTALLVIPAAAGLRAGAHFRGAVLIALGAAVFSVVGGILTALRFDLPVSATIVLLSFLVFLAVLGLRRARA